MEKIAKAIVVKIDKVGHNQHDIIIAVRTIPLRCKMGQIAVATTDNSTEKDWQAHNLIIVDEDMHNIKDGDMVYVESDNVDNRRIWKYMTPPCTMPYWGNQMCAKKILGSYLPIEGVAPISIDFVREWVNNPDGEVVCEYSMQGEDAKGVDGSGNEKYYSSLHPKLYDGYLKLSIKVQGCESKYPHMSEWQSYVDGCIANKRKPLAYVDWISSSIPAAPSILDGTQEIEPPVGSFILEQKDIQGILANDGMYYHYSKVCELLNRYAASKVDTTKWASDKDMESAYDEGVDYGRDDVMVGDGMINASDKTGRTFSEFITDYKQDKSKK